MSRTAYLDASALVKLAVAETESHDLERYLAGVSDAVTSAVSMIEVPRAACRARGDDSAIELGEEIVRRCTLVDTDGLVAREAARARPPDLGSLDAIHLCSALRVRAILDAFVTYDERLADAARAAGLTVASPGRKPA